MIKVMMLGPFPRSPEKIDGGVAAAVTYLAQALALQPGIELTGVRVSGGHQESNSVDALAWPVIDLPLGSGSVSTLFWRQKRRFRELVEQYRPDIVHAQGADVSGLLAVNARVPAVVTIHGVLGECAKLQTSPVARIRDQLQSLITEKPAVRGASDIISISPYVADYYRNEIGGRIHDIPNAVSPGFFNVSRRPERGRYLFAGRISKGKGVLDLVRAAGIARDAITKLVLAGGTPDIVFQDEVQREVVRLGLENRVVFAGLLDERALLQEFAVAEALVLPSYQETAPMVIQQAMAAGLPVLTTRAGGIPFQITDGSTGLQHEAGDVGGLASLFQRMKAESGLGDRLGLAGKRAAEARYAAASVAQATRAVYESMLSR